jgi:hypothetical protein
MTDTILKQNAGRGGAQIVTNTTVPAGDYCAVQWVTSGTITTALNAPLLIGTQTGITYPALLRIDTPITGGTGVITGTAIFYKSLSSSSI